jgi:leucyl-tRNA synthetase
VAAIMELLNEIYAYALPEKDSLPENLNPAIISELAETLILLMAPFAPHMGEELWQQYGKSDSVYRAPWPDFDPEQIFEETVNVMIQVNGKIKDKISVALDCGEEDVKREAMKCEKIKQLLAGRQIVKMIFVKNKMLSIVCK